jgi:hypothetical protein
MRCLASSERGIGTGLAFYLLEKLVASPNFSVRNDFPHIHTSHTLAWGLADLRVSAKPHANTSFIDPYFARFKQKGGCAISGHFFLRL